MIGAGSVGNFALKGRLSTPTCAFARANDRKQAFEAGFHMHLAKPVDLAELESALVQLTQVTRGRPASDQRIM